MERDYSNKIRGFLFPNKNAKKDNHPKHTGRMKITKTQIMTLFNRAKSIPEGAGSDYELDCEIAAFSRKDKNSDPYLFLSIDAEEPRPQQASGNNREREDNDVPY